jgi:hypothetical protein
MLDMLTSAGGRTVSCPNHCGVMAGVTRPCTHQLVWFSQAAAVCAVMPATASVLPARPRSTAKAKQIRLVMVMLLLSVKRC